MTVPTVRDEIDPAWHLYPIRLNLEMLTVGSAEIFRALRAENIGVNVHYIPVHHHPYYRDRFESQGRGLSSGGDSLRATDQPANVSWHDG